MRDALTYADSRLVHQAGCLPNLLLLGDGQRIGIRMTYIETVN